VTRFGYDRFADLLFTWNKRKGHWWTARERRTRWTSHWKRRLVGAMHRDEPGEGSLAADQTPHPPL